MTSAVLTASLAEPALTGHDVLEAIELADALAEVGWSATIVDIDREIDELARLPGPLLCLADRFDPATALAERHPGPGGLRMYLEHHGVEFVGSSTAGFRSSSSASKARARHLLRDVASQPPWLVLNRSASVPTSIGRDIPLPVVIKPSLSSGASLGVRYADSESDALDWITDLFDAGCEEIIVEGFIDGRELTVWVFEIDGHAEVYSIIAVDLPDGVPILTQGAKLLARTSPTSPSSPIERFGAVYDPAPPLTSAAQASITAVSLSVHQHLGLADLSRVDLVMTRTGEVSVIEVNASPQVRDGTLGIAARGRNEDLGTAVTRLLARRPARVGALAKSG